MKNYFVFFFLLLTPLAFCQLSWQIVGGKMFSNCSADYPAICLDKLGNPNIVFGNANTGGQPSVMRFTNNIWHYVGESGFVNDKGRQYSLVFDKNNVPHVCYWGNDGRLSVLFFNGNNWEFLGNPSFTPYDATFPAMAFDTSNTLYIAFRDFSQGGRASVMKFNDNSWTYVGSPGFSAGTSTIASGAAELSLKINSENIPYLSFLDQVHDYKLSVMKFNGINWEYVGAPTLTEGSINATSLAFDTTGLPVVAFVNHNLGGKASVIRFNGISWAPVGTPACSPGKAALTSLQIDSRNRIYVSFKDFNEKKRASVVYFNEGVWDYLGNKGFSDSTVWHLSSACTSNGEMFVSFKDESTISPKNSVTVMNYNGHVVTSGEIDPVPKIEVFPNPSNGMFSITNLFTRGAIKVSVFNNIGEIIYSRYVDENSKEIDISKHPKGLYILKCETDKGTFTKKIVVQ
jgi:hypothetical protein